MTTQTQVKTQAKKPANRTKTTQYGDLSLEGKAYHGCKVTSKHKGPLPDTGDSFECKVVFSDNIPAVSVKLSRTPNEYEKSKFDVFFGYEQKGNGSCYGSAPALGYSHKLHKITTAGFGFYLPHVKAAIGVALYYFLEQYSPDFESFEAWMAKWAEMTAA